MPQAGNRIIGRNRAFADFLQQFSEGSSIHLKIQINTKTKSATEARSAGGNRVIG
jgi:hypothetical protein